MIAFLTALALVFTPTAAAPPPAPHVSGAVVWHGTKTIGPLFVHRYHRVPGWTWRTVTPAR